MSYMKLLKPTIYVKRGKIDTRNKQINDSSL